LNLTSYIITVLLDDERRNTHKSNLEYWINMSEEKDASALVLLAHNTLEKIADGLAEGKDSSLLASYAMVVRAKEGNKVS
jgi:hypothetical protein